MFHTKKLNSINIILYNIYCAVIEYTRKLYIEHRYILTIHAKKCYKDTAFFIIFSKIKITELLFNR